MNEEEIKQYLKDNLKIVIYDDLHDQDRKIKIKLFLNDEIISEDYFYTDAY